MSESADISAAPRRMLVDSATLIGLAAAFALITLAVILGGTFELFFNLPAALIVLGGTLAVTIVCFSFRDLAEAGTALGSTVMYREHDPRDTAYTMLELADFCRTNGALKLQGAPLLRFAKEPILYKGLGLVIDGLGENDVREILQHDIAAEGQRPLRAAQVLRKAAEVAPAMGLIGTLIGLVQMLGRLQDPDVIGPAMAVALLTTFYGAILATLVLNPLASKIERNVTEEYAVNQIFLAGLTAIARKDHPRRLEIQLNSVLPPEHKVKYFE